MWHIHTKNSVPIHILANLLKLVALSAAVDLGMQNDLHFPKNTKEPGMRL